VATKSEEKTMKGRQPKILLIDDDVDFVTATKTVLESKPYEVITAYQGDEGLKKVREEKPDLIILDIIMPAKSGFTVCDELKRDPQLSKIPVLLLTSLSQRIGEVSISVSEGLTVEAEDYIDKPVSPEELFKRVDKQLKKVGF